MLNYGLAGRSQNVLFNLYLIDTKIEYQKNQYFVYKQSMSRRPISNIIIYLDFKSIRFSRSKRRSSVKTHINSGTLEKHLDIHPQKRRPSAISRGKVSPEAKEEPTPFYGYSSRRFSSVSWPLVQGLKSPYVVF